MRRSAKTTLMKRGLMTAVAAIGVTVFAIAGPAGAAGVVEGSGVGVGGDETNPVISDPCSSGLAGTNPISARVPDYDLYINNNGTYGGASDNPGGPVALYVGPTRVHVSAHNFHFSPIGTHDEDLPGGCLAPVPVPITARVDGTAATGDVHCTGSGVMVRAQSAVTIEFDGPCTVTGNQPLATGTVKGNPTFHVLEGLLVPCNVPNFENPEEPGPRNPACDEPSFAAQFPDVGARWDGTYVASGASAP